MVRMVTDTVMDMVMDIKKRATMTMKTILNLSLP